MPYHVLLPGAPTRNTERSNSNINLDESVEQEESAPSASKVVGKECIAVEDGEDSKFEGINDDEHRCAFFIKRRRRRCTKRSCDCNSFCSDHQEGALARDDFINGGEGFEGLQGPFGVASPRRVGGFRTRSAK